MKFNFEKRDIYRIYNLSSWLFKTEIEEKGIEIVVKKTKQTFTPKELTRIINGFGFPPNCQSDEEENYLRKIVRLNS